MLIIILIGSQRFEMLNCPAALAQFSCKVLQRGKVVSTTNDATSSSLKQVVDTKTALNVPLCGEYRAIVLRREAERQGIQTPDGLYAHPLIWSCADPYKQGTKRYQSSVTAVYTRIWAENRTRYAPLCSSNAYSIQVIMQLPICVWYRKEILSFLRRS